MGIGYLPHCKYNYKTNIIDEIIVKLQPEHIITTNYDHLLENVNDPRVSKYAVITKDDDILSKKGRNCIWRIPTAGFAEQNGRNAKLNSR